MRPFTMSSSGHWLTYRMRRHYYEDIYEGEQSSSTLAQAEPTKDNGTWVRFQLRCMVVQRERIQCRLDLL